MNSHNKKKSMCGTLLLAVLLLLSAALVAAEETAPIASASLALPAVELTQASEVAAVVQSQAQTAPAPNTALVKMAPLDTSAVLGKTFGGLAIIVVLIFACAKAARLFGGPMGNQQPLLKLVAVLPLGSKEKLALIEVGGKQVLIGITAQQINPLMELSEPVKAPQVTPRNTALSASSAAEFSKKLNEFLHAGNRPT